MNNLELCQTAICLVHDIFGWDNLLFAFIAGSRSKGNYSQHSDIDLFVVLRQPSRAKEKFFAEELKKLHEKQGLMYEHCGEIFSQPTLDTLLKGVKNLDFLVENNFCQLACYQTDCILSIARKTQVVLHMLSEEKNLIIGDRGVLQKYEVIAKNFYLRHGDPPSQLHLQKLQWIENSISSRMKARWQSYVSDIENKEFCDTPVGIGLERWLLLTTFSDEVPSKLLSKVLHSPQMSVSIHCPLCDTSIHEDISRLLRSQCLGIVQNV